ncbi:MAG: hypothetical protein KDD55_03010 [Bdellovibrionales bacterium]|nr:hypothetical protein [Bdellovibrionales bacterium]
MSRFLIFLFFLLNPFSLLAQARTADLSSPIDERGKPELVVCSQNLENYGSLDDVHRREKQMTKTLLAEKEAALVKRFLKAKCDVIAVQELLGATQAKAKAALEHLAKVIQYRSNRVFHVYAGPTNSKISRNGYLVAADVGEVVNTLSYARVELPKISEEQKPREFVRGPYELQIQVNAKGDTGSKLVTLVNFHLKSKAFNSKDPTELEWETLRMEMAEAIRRIVLRRHEESFASGESLLVVLGDRNSNFDAASARILTGELTLQHFQGAAPCRLNKRGVPLCAPGVALPAKLFSVLIGDERLRMRPGTYQYEKTFSWLDEILVPAETIGFATERVGVEGRYLGGVYYEPEEASDHALVAVGLNW